MNPEEQVDRILEHAADVFGFNKSQDALVVGVSGGPDSLALLHLLQSHLSLDQLIVAHLDHALRPSSVEEERMVANAAKGLRYFSDRVDVAELARNRGLSIEDAGRTARYEFLSRVAENMGAIAIAVGHNADDQVETILMHMLRGSGAAGLRGMLPVSTLPGRPGLWLIRPLLRLTRDSILEYCQTHNLSPIFDESNVDTIYFRNRIRHELLPVLESFTPDFRRRILELSEIITADEEVLTDLTSRVEQEIIRERSEDSISLDLGAWRELPLALRRRLLRQAIAEIVPSGREVSFSALEAYRRVAETADSGSMADLPCGGKLRVSYGQLMIHATPDVVNSDFPQISQNESRTLSIPGEVQLENGWHIAAEWLDSPDIAGIQSNTDPWTAYIYCQPTPTLFVRTRRRGERFWPLGMSGEVKIKEIMINRKIPRYLREGWPLIASEEHGVWIAGHVIDHRVRVLPHHRSAVRLRCRPPGKSGAS